MTITRVSAGNYTIDTTTELKNTYPDHQVFINDELVSTALPTTKSLIVGVHTVKLVLRNNSASHTDTQCLLVDDMLECTVASYISNISKEDRNVTDVPYLYYLLKEGTTGSNECGCLCTDLKNVYQLIQDEIFKVTTC